MQFSFNNLNITLIGPASHSFAVPINSVNDRIVARINHSYPVRGISKRYSGEKTDIYYPNPEILSNINSRMEDVKTIRTDRKFQSDIPEIIKDKTSYYNFDFDKYCEIIGCNINTGMAAILDIFLGKPKNFRIIGISFYKDDEPYHPEYTSKQHTKLMKYCKGNISAHNQDLQLDYFKKEIFPHVETCDHLKSIIRNW